MSGQDNYSQITDSMIRLMTASKMERMAYLILSLVSFVVLLVFLYFKFKDGNLEDLKIQDYAVIFGPTGVMGLSLVMVLRVWSNCISILRLSIEKEMQK